MEETEYELPEQLILARQANLLRTFYKFTGGLTVIALLLIALLPGFATSEEVLEPFIRNLFVALTIGLLYWLVEKDRVLASIIGTIVACGFFACYSIFMESPGNMQMMTLIVFPVCVAGLLPRRSQFWLVYVCNFILMLFTFWLIINYRGVVIENRSLVTVGLLLTLVALLIDVLSSSYRESLSKTFSQLLEIQKNREKLVKLDADLETAVSERMRAETVSTLLAQTGRLALEAAGAGAIVIDIDSNDIDITQDFLKDYGFTDHPRNLEELVACIHMSDRTRFKALIEQNLSAHERLEGDFRIDTKHSVYWMFVLEAEAERKLQGIVVDVTNRVLEQQRRYAEEDKAHESQRLESLGMLAGAIAHDFNNLLHVIMLNADLARNHLNADSKSAVSIDRLMTTVNRAAELCSELLAYSGRGHFTIEPFDAEQLVGEMKNLLEISTPKGVAIEMSTDGSNPTINGDITQIRQVIMNLITNAGEAIGNRPDGLIRIAVATQDYDRSDLELKRFIEDVEPGKFVSIIVEDNGAGMDPSTIKRMFDPFFSTKETGHGLGLSAVLGIVRGHQGTISVESSVEAGTSISTLFPLDQNSQQRVIPAAASPQAVPSQGLILFVDDEEEIRDLGSTVLNECGYSVIEASNGQEAIDIFTDRHEELRLVIIDLMMPHKTGLEAYFEISEIDKSVPVVFSSGFNESELLQQLPPKTRAAFLKKPYLANDLSTFVESIIGRRD